MSKVLSFLYHSRCILFVISGILLYLPSASAQEQDPANQKGDESVVLHVDPRLALLTKYEETQRSAVPVAANGRVSGVIRSGRGYRVMIYSGTDRYKANSTKADFMRRYPGIRIYMTYALPQYRIKVGDFTSRQEAHELYRQLTGTYSPCMVVPDIIEINTFRKNDPINTPEGK